jgi:uncharacterized membrane protein
MSWLEWGWHIDMMAFGVGFVFIVLLLLADGLMRSDPPPVRRLPSPEEVLKLRYAAGGIDRKSYLEMLEELQGR